MPRCSSWIVAAGGMAALFLPAAHGRTQYMGSQSHLRSNNSPQLDTKADRDDAGGQVDSIQEGARALTYSDPAPATPEATPAPATLDSPAPHCSSPSTEAPVDVETAAPTSSTTMEPATPAPIGEDIEAEYLGCFHDRKEDRVLGDKFNDRGMTTKMCFDYCTELGAAFMATQWGFECWCSPDGGLDYNRHYDMIGEDAVCDMPCMGDETEICGGYDSFELYKLDPESPECSTPVEIYEQCGGEDWTGSTCCSDGLECVDVSGLGCYEQCRPISTEETTPSPTAPATSMEAPTPAPVTDMPVAPIPDPTRPPTAPEVPDTPSPVTEEPVTPPATPGGSVPADMQVMLDLHNKARCAHNADPLTWSSEVEASAAVHAKRMSDRCSGLFHSSSEERNGYGENIYWCGGSDSCYSAESAMNGFYDSEVQTDSVTGYGGHATQILWKSTEKLGCAISSCSGGTYLACQYDPPHLRSNNSPQLDTNVDRDDAGGQVDSLQEGARALTYSDPAPATPEATPAPATLDSPAPHCSSPSTEAPVDVETAAPTSSTTMEPATPAPIGEDIEAEYLGCFHDRKEDRVLGDKFDDRGMTTMVRGEYPTENEQGEETWFVDVCAFSLFVLPTR
eukprot:g7295.t1